LLKSFAKYTNVDIDEAANLFDYMRHWPNRPNKLLFKTFDTVYDKRVMC